MMPEAKDKPKRPKSTKSFPTAPMVLPAGPPLAYPTEYMALKMNTANPRAAAGIGKYIPAQKSHTRVVGAN